MKKSEIYDIKISIVLRGFWFLIGLSGLLLFLMVLFRPKWYREGIWEPITEIHDGFYSLDKDSIDVAFIGSSQIFVDINPMLIWKETGIASYDLTSSVQRIWISKYYVQEVLKYQSPKVIVLEVGTIFYESPNDEDRNRKALDYMKFSKEKMEAVQASIKGSIGETSVSYVLPIIRYHKRWKNLIADDFMYFVKERDFYLRGFDPRYKSEPLPLDQLLLSDPVSGKLPEKNRELLDDIIAICKKRGVELIMLKVPTSMWTIEQHNEIAQISRANDVEFIDYNMMIDDIQLVSEDFSDINHLNINGANKVSVHLGNYLNSNFLFKKEYDTGLWERDYQLYLEYDESKREETGFSQ